MTTNKKGINVTILHDMKNNQVIKILDTSNINGSIMDYYYDYFGGYENYISYLLKKGAIEVVEEDVTIKDAQTSYKIVQIYEIEVLEG